MAWALQFDGSNDKVDLPAYSSTFTTYVEMEISFSPPAAPVDLGKLFGTTTGPANSQKRGTFLLEYSASGGVYNFYFTDVDNNRRQLAAFSATDTAVIYKFRTYYDAVAQTFEGFISENGGAETSLGFFSSVNRDLYANFPTVTLGYMALTGYGNFLLHGFNMDIDGTDVRTYDPSASNGTGQTLVDTTGSQNATLGSGFPTDDSQWVQVTSPTAPALTVTQTELTPGGTISGTYANYETVPTTLTVSDGTNTIGSDTGEITGLVINDNGDGSGDFGATMPDLPASGTADLIQFTDEAIVELT